MIAETTEKVNGRHMGRNVQRIRMYFGVKQGALAADLGISQPEISEIENQVEKEESMLAQIADALGVSPEVIKNFDEDRAIYNINNVRNNTFEQGPTSIAQFKQGTISLTSEINAVDKIVELYERLLQSEKEKVELLKNK